MGVYTLFQEVPVLNNVSDTSQVVIFPPLLYIGSLLLGLLVQSLYPLPRVLSLPLGSGLISSGLVLLIAGVQVMRQAGTNVKPSLPTTALVVNGPFPFSRNPIYLAFTLLYGGIAVLIHAVWAVWLLPIVLGVLHYGVIAREEKYLERKFGSEYLAYKSRVRRWI